MLKMSFGALRLLAPLLLLFLITGCTSHQDIPELSWPCARKEHRPWTYWWWPGSAVDADGITANLEAFAGAGLGGVHIIPIYGVRGEDDREIPFLSDRWVAMLDHTIAEAERLGLGVDMTTGTGWPFGGPSVCDADAAKRIVFDTESIARNSSVRIDVDLRDMVAVAAFTPEGEFVDLSQSVRDADGGLSWRAPEGTWRLITARIEGTGQQVKRAAPGGAGNVLDYFAEMPLIRYLRRFDTAFGLRDSVGVRAFYNDSFEVYGSNWTGDFITEFDKRRGFDITRYLFALADTSAGDIAARIRHDYNETIADMLLERFTEPWVGWSHDHGGLTRNQAHGSPGNLLDLYAAADIPETEAFGTSRFPIPGLRHDTSIPEHFGKPDYFVEKFASSAAHVAGKPLVSSESCTWLGEHFNVSLAQVKPEIDALFTAGVNHVFYHGIAYSPPDEPWPGWLFYASTNFGPTGSFWRHLPVLNRYICRCQSFLQSGEPDADILLYWPVHDAWNNPADDDLLHHFQVHNADEWLDGTPFHRVATTLRSRGYTFDYVSDRMIRGLEYSDGVIVSSGSVYRTIVVPQCETMPPSTLEALASLVEQGATVIFSDDLPRDVPGYGNLALKRKAFKNAGEVLRSYIVAGEAPSAHDTGQVRVGGDLDTMLSSAGIPRESFVDAGLSFIRRRHEEGYIYFIVNLGRSRIDKWYQLGTSGKTGVFFDPMREKRGRALIKRNGMEHPCVYVQLDPGESIILKTFETARFEVPEWRYAEPVGDGVPLVGEWDVVFTDGAPEIPKNRRISDLVSWTAFGGDAARDYHGTAVYRTSFKKPSGDAESWMLDLGRVCESARVTVNGRDAGFVWCHPFRIEIGEYLKRGENTLEVEVLNLAANRIAMLDRTGTDWKKFKDINYVTIQYEAFDASAWPPVDSGLLGPVTLIPVTSSELH